MAKLAAFVGHSFVDQDKAVVHAFLEFFSRVSDLDIGFSWDHAEAAEPEELSVKVKKKMEGKNLFIGICTAKERTIAPEKLSASLLRKQYVQGLARDFEVKTSDWLLQEIGYALGKDMDLILLLEAGLRIPGGLQGNIEYILFDRSKPADSFNKILEMLKSLRPRSPLPDAEPPPAETSMDRETHADTVTRSADPEPSWSEETYEEAIFRAVLEKDKARVSSLAQAFAASPHGADLHARDRLDAFVINWRHVLGHGSDVARLRELADRYPQDSRLQTYAARALARFDQFSEAASYHIRAANTSSDSSERVSAYAEAAINKYRAGDEHVERWLRDHTVQLLDDDVDAQSSFTWAMREITEKDAATEKWLAYSEARLSARPDDQQLRFNLAFKYSTTNERLALYHYLLIPRASRSDAVWNNIGAAYHALQLHSLAIAAYKESEKLGTRAVGNMAHILTEVGFTQEAEDLCDKALKTSPGDDRLASAVVSISTKQSEDEKKKDAVLEQAKLEHNFRVRLGRACLVRDAESGRSKWKTPECELDVEIVGSVFRAIGTYVKEEKPGLRLAALLSPGVLTPPSPARKNMLVQYGGSIAGHSAFYRKETKEEGAVPSLLSSSVETGAIVFDFDSGTAEAASTGTSEKFSLDRWSLVVTGKR